MKISKKAFMLFATLTLLLSLSGCIGSNISEETEVILHNGLITVDGEIISEDDSQAVYAAAKIETHEDVPAELSSLENTVITIAAAGTYRISGTASDTQLAVSAGEEDSVTIILDGVDITCRTAPALQVYTAYEPYTEGQYGVTIELASGSENVLNGSHALKTESDDIKHDGAVSSNISLGFTGGGRLTVNGDREGIEVKSGHLTFEDGIFYITAGDDPINGSEDGVCCITINGGYIFTEVNQEIGSEGDGIDSNGKIIINGGTVIALAHPSSGDSGLDSDMGTYINGGTVIGAGNMFDEIESDSQQPFMHLQFSQATDNLLVVTDSENNAIFAYDFPYSYGYISLSTSDLQVDETYHVFMGGEIEGTEKDGFYMEITSYSGGVQMSHGGTAQAGGFGNRPQRPDGNKVPTVLAEGEPPTLSDSFVPPEETDGERSAPPDNVDGGRGGMGGRSGMQTSGDTASFDFVLTEGAYSFTNVSASK